MATYTDEDTGISYTDHQLTAAISRLSDLGIVYDYAGQYGEPGYSSNGPVLMGDWWCRCNDNPDDQDNDRPLHGIEHRYPEEFAILKAAEAELEWYDEWAVDHYTSKAYRTKSDSYSWQPSAVYSDDGELMTPDDDIEVWIEWAKDNHQRCLMSRITSSSELIEAGFQKHNGTYEAGWYGADERPEDSYKAIRDLHGKDVEIVFLLDDNEQFRMLYSAWFRGGDDSYDDDSYDETEETDK